MAGKGVYLTKMSPKEGKVRILMNNYAYGVDMAKMAAEGRDDRAGRGDFLKILSD